MEPRTITPELRKRMNRAGIVFFILALVLIGFLTLNFSKQYDPAFRAQKDKEAAALKAAKAAAKAEQKTP
ncbi:MAG: hypothetical protein HQL91_11200 [Magnetococcales bacterium]|nr:hypothetical protein [Magnetococcales bacterium]